MNAIATNVAAQTNVATAAPLSAIDARIAKLQALIGKEVTGYAIHTTKTGVLLQIGSAFGPNVSEVGLLQGHAMWNTAPGRFQNPGAAFKVTIVSVKRRPNFADQIWVELSERATPVFALQPLVGTDTKVTGIITGRYDDYLTVELPHYVEARLPLSKLGGTSLDALKKGGTVKAQVHSIDGMHVTLTREGIDSAHARARRDAHRAENRLLDQQFRSSKKSSGGGKNSGGGKKKK